jgi:hypothetical protein
MKVFLTGVSGHRPDVLEDLERGSYAVEHG